MYKRPVELKQKKRSRLYRGVREIYWFLKYFGLTYEEKLKRKGMMIGENVVIMGNIDGIYPHLIKIEDNVVVANQSMIIVHGRFMEPKKIVLEEGCYIGAGAIILNSSVGRRAIIGAGAVVTRDVPSYEIWVGNPARRLRKTDAIEYENKSFR
jgi:acetyltransferase-like isoleucine patch superfamily enzyme